MEDVKAICKATAIVLLPVAAEMMYEHVAFHNLFSVFGAVSEVPQVREGHIRASGPFAHPILAGTVGAVTLPLMIGIWRQYRYAAAAGVVACLTIVLMSRSSGPFMSALVSVAALGMWSFRHRLRQLRWAAVSIYLALELVMQAPAYYLISRIDITGGSTGWHRARLIEMSMQHLNEWWLTGTDFTRHWMPTGVTWNLRHTDITNHYLQMGVWGGLPLMLLFLAVLLTAFAFVGRRIRDDADPVQDRFFAWALGASLFAHVATCISVSYFDQSVFFLYLTLGAIAATRSRQPEAPPVPVKTEVASPIAIAAALRRRAIFGGDARPRGASALG
jgi:hypothetical protein